MKKVFSLTLMVMLFASSSFAATGSNKDKLALLSGAILTVGGTYLFADGQARYDMDKGTFSDMKAQYETRSIAGFVIAGIGLFVLMSTHWSPENMSSKDSDCKLNIESISDKECKISVRKKF